MRRLFSTFARGSPGLGLLLMRVVAGTVVVAAAAARLEGPSAGPVAAGLLAIVSGLSLLVGLWTPIAGSLVAATEMSFALTGAGDPLTSLLIATMGVALALIGPGAWSIDARLFGWRRIDVHHRSR